MLIDWFTVGAQALNFLILVWLMKRFLYKPILDAIDAREKKIAAELADAEAKKVEAKKERDEFQHKNEEFDQQKAALLKKATDEAGTERQRLLEEARKAAEILSTKHQETLWNDARMLNQSITRRTQDEVFAIARMTLADLATTSLEESMGEVFIRHLRALDEPAKAALASALTTSSEPALLRSALALSAEQRAKIQKAINETFSADIHLQFETVPDLVSGIELASNGQKVAWSIADYLASMEKGVNELLKPKEKTKLQVKAKTDAKPEAKPETETKEAESKVEVKIEPNSDAENKPGTEEKTGSKPAGATLAPAKS